MFANNACHRANCPTDILYLVQRLHCNQHARILVIRQKRIIATPSLRVFYIRPSTHKVSMRHDAREFTSNGAVHGLSDVEVCGEQNIKVPLVDLQTIINTVKACGEKETEKVQRSMNVPMAL